MNLKIGEQKFSEQKLFNGREKNTLFFLWILLKFKKSIIDEDIHHYFGDEWKTVVHAKILFDKVYIMRDEIYKNGFLMSISKLKRKDFYHKRKF